jgi:hypothetical protein
MAVSKFFGTNPNIRTIEASCHIKNQYEQMNIEGMKFTRNVGGEICGHPKNPPFQYFLKKISTHLFPINPHLFYYKYPIA